MALPTGVRNLEVLQRTELSFGHFGVRRTTHNPRCLRAVAEQQRRLGLKPRAPMLQHSGRLEFEVIEVLQKFEPHEADDTGHNAQRQVIRVKGREREQSLQRRNSQDRPQEYHCP